MRAMGDERQQRKEWTMKFRVKEIRRRIRRNSRNDPYTTITRNGDDKTVHIETACGHRIDLDLAQLYRAVSKMKFD